MAIATAVLFWDPAPTALAQDLEMLQETVPDVKVPAETSVAPNPSKTETTGVEPSGSEATGAGPTKPDPATAGAEPETAKPEVVDDEAPSRRADDDQPADKAADKAADPVAAEVDSVEVVAGYETWEPRKASDLLPAEVLSGPHHRVLETVGSFGYQHRYQVESDFGSFRVSGDSMLRRLLREIAALAALRAAIPDDTSPPEGVAAPALLWEDPVATVTALPDGPFAIINRGNGRLAANGANGAAIPIAAVQEAKRDLAYRLSVDVYSSNAVLQRALNRAAWTAVVSGEELSLEVHLPAGRPSDRRGDRLAAQILRDIGPKELRVENRRALALMGFPEPLIDRFLDHQLYSPRHRTIIVQALEALPEVAGRRRLVEAALGVTSETGALFYQQVAETLAAIQADSEAAPGKLAELVEFGGLILAYGEGGSGVLPLPLDCARWTGPFAHLMKQLATAHPRVGDGTKIQIWVTGRLSQRARDELAALGLEVVETVAEKIALAD